MQKHFYWHLVQKKEHRKNSRQCMVNFWTYHGCKCSPAHCACRRGSWGTLEPWTPAGNLSGHTCWTEGVEGSLQTPAAAAPCKAPSRLPAANALTFSWQGQVPHPLHPKQCHVQDSRGTVMSTTSPGNSGTWIHHWTGVIPSKQPVELAEWHAFSRTNQQRVLIPKLG